MSSVDGVEDDGDGQVTGVRLGDGSVIDGRRGGRRRRASCPRPAGSKGRGSRSTTAWCATRRAWPRPGSSPPATSRAGRTRSSTASSMRLEHWTNATEQGVHAAAPAARGDDRTVRAGAVRVVRPVRPQDPDRRRGVDRADADVHIAHGTLAERQFVALFGRGGRLHRRARFQPAPPRDAVPADHLRARVVGSRPAARRRVSEAWAGTETGDGTGSGAAPDRLLTPRFLLVVTCGLCYFLALAMLTPVLPHYVEDSLARGECRGRSRGRRVRGRCDHAASVRRPARRSQRSAGADHRRRADRRGVDARLRRRARALVARVDAGRDRVRRGGILRGRGDDDHRPVAGRTAGRGDLATGRSRSTAACRSGPRSASSCAARRATTLTFVVSAALALAAAIVGLFTVEVPRTTTEAPSAHLLHRAAVDARQRALPRA